MTLSFFRANVIGFAVASLPTLSNTCAPKCTERRPKPTLKEKDKPDTPLSF
ncbi:hypothetical protein SOASR030_26290 [Leminorella grimontii]|uniref:Lipoprotein n=2 Tax=Leminorella grimontii TaxID=82981 RepID=A0AAV5N729_9GAMM|nr:hypothetical protein SOASR030_26290 [Leminorella grimontii]GKX59883.1 hypothetical protein SOASR031_21980 [Leminorella grimontii]